MGEERRLRFLEAEAEREDFTDMYSAFLLSSQSVRARSLLSDDERVALREGWDGEGSVASVSTGKLRRLRSSVGGIIEGADIIARVVVLVYRAGKGW